jgi:GH24 family phage-related lysozyme (muramidase)
MKIFIGKVENRNDPLKLGRCQVRVIGVHDENPAILPTIDLPWAMPISPINSASSAGIGVSPTGIVLGSIVLVTFTDKDDQTPVILGTLAGIPQNQNNSLVLKPSDRKGNINTAVKIGSDGVSKLVSGQISSNVNIINAVAKQRGGIVETAAQVVEDSKGLLKGDLEVEKARPFSTFSVTDDSVKEIIKNTAFTDVAAQITDSSGKVIKTVIGYGQDTFQGKPVTTSFPGSIDKETAQQAFKDYLQVDVADKLTSFIRAPVNQEMFDSVMSVASDIGVQNFVNSSIPKLMNSLDYQGAAGAIQGILNEKSFDNILGGITSSSLQSSITTGKDLFANLTSGTDLGSTITSSIQNISGSLLNNLGGTADTITSNLTNIANLGNLSNVADISNLISGGGITGGISNVLSNTGIGNILNSSTGISNISNVLNAGDIGATVTNILGGVSGNISSAVSNLASGGISNLIGGFGGFALGGLGGKLFGGRSSTKKARRSAAAKKFTSVGVPNLGGTLFDENTAYVKPITDGGQFGNAGLVSNSAAGSFGVASGYLDYVNEPDTSRLARHENIDKTSVYVKESARALGIERFNYDTWDQSEIPYNAEYPFNKVVETERGHVFELDDTPNAERINIFHKRGSWMEWDHNGTLTDRVVGDRYCISERNTFELVGGTKNLTVYGELNAVLKAGAKLRVDGPGEVVINNDCKVTIAGDMNLNVGGEFRLIASQIRMESKGMATLGASQVLELDGSKVDIGNGFTPSGLALTSNEIIDTQMPVIPELQINSRSAREYFVYEVPDEGDAIEHRERQVQRGLYIRKNLDLGNVLLKTTPTIKSDIETAEQKCEYIYGLTSYDPSLQLSARIQLGALNRNGSIPIIAQMGIEPKQIVCNLKGIATYLIEPMKDLFKNVLIVNGYRNNQIQSGSPDISQHYVGEAVDIIFSSWNRAQHFQAATDLVLSLPYGFDRIVLSYAGKKSVWLHCSWKYSGNRFETLTMRDHLKVSDGFSLIAEVK